MLANDQKIKDLCDNLDGLVDRLSALRAQGLVRLIQFGSLYMCVPLCFIDFSFVCKS